MHPRLLTIKVRLAKYDQDLPPPCLGQSIQRLCEESAKKLGASPPERYCAFLRQVDGLIFNGLTIYSSGSPGGPEEVEGFVEENLERYRTDLTGFERTLVFGEDSLGFYCQDLDSKKYRIESWGGIVTREYDRFEELLDEALANVTGSEDV